MKSAAQTKLHAQGQEITIYTPDFEHDFISLTDIAKYRSDEPNDVIRNWLRNRETLEYLGLWEKLHNPNFKPVEFDGFRTQAGLHSFTMSPKKWIDNTGAIGIIVKSGRHNGGTFAHPDIAFEFASWISPEFKLYVVQDYQKLKTDENNRLSKSWNLRRELAKLNYHFHTDAIKNELIPTTPTSIQTNHIYANEADVLNVALFGQTAKEWRTSHPTKNGNIRDYASHNQLLILANLENYNAIMIKEGIDRPTRLAKLRQLAEYQTELLKNYPLQFSDHQNPQLPPNQ